MLKAPLDLSQLALDRAPASENVKRPSLQYKRRWFSRYALPLGILSVLLLCSSLRRAIS